MVIFYRKNFYTRALERMIKENHVRMGKELNFLRHLVSIGIIKYKKDYKHQKGHPGPAYYLSNKRLDNVLNQMDILIRSSKVYDLKDLS